jgi:probable HAF family extracellular repeat protein
MIDLGPLQIAYGINDAGQVVGGSPAAMWENGSITNLGNSWYAFAVNNSAQVVMTDYSASFLWDDGVATDLGNLGGGYPWAYAMNNVGQVVGGSTTSSGEQRAFLWTDGAMRDLGTLGGNYSFAYGINDAGQVVGETLNASGSYRAFLWEEGRGMIDLGLIDGTDSGAMAINNVGQVVGWEWREETGNRAFLWQNGVMTFLGAPPGGEPHYPRAINDLGQVVGVREIGYEERAIFWKKLTSQEILQGGIDEIVTLVNLGVLNQGEATALINTLNTAAALLSDGKTTPAVNQLRAFVTRVERMIATGKLTASEGQPLIDAALAVINST